MKGFVAASIAVLLSVVAVGQSGTPSPVHTSVCEVLDDPHAFEGRLITVHGRYITNWEWGDGIIGDPCDRGVAFALAEGHSTPSFLSNLQVRKDAAFLAFQKQEQSLSSADSLGEFDYIEADFTGVVVAPGHFPVLPYRSDTVLVVTAVAAPKLHRGNVFGVGTPSLPAAIPESQEHR